jgi:hypothetical protein
MPKMWKKGRGKLGILQPLLGSWAATAESPMGPVRCTRVFEAVLGGAYVRLDAHWIFGAVPEKAAESCEGPSGKGGKG